MIGNHPSRVENFLKKSLQNLKTSYVDVYLIHFPVGFQYYADDNYFPKDQDGNIQLDFSYSDLVSLWRAMEEQVIAGRTKAIGVSNFSRKQIAKILESARIPPSNLQVIHYQ
jgi:diketogulonate reductase-like aldo/keto reductase